MAIYKLIANGSLAPDEIAVMRAAYEAALAELDVTEQHGPITELIAKAILNVTLRGERDPKEIKERALHALGLRLSFDGRAAIPTFFGPCTSIYLLAVLAIIAGTIIAAETAQPSLDANGNIAKIFTKRETGK